METFRINKAIKVVGIWYTFLALVTVGLGLVWWGMEKWNVTAGPPWPPLVVGAGALWLLYELRRSVRNFTWSMSLSDDFVCVGRTRKQWNEIRTAEIWAASGRRVAIVLHTAAGDRLHIPATVERNEYIKGFVQSHVQQITGVQK